MKDENGKRIVSEETRAKIRAAHVGKSLSESTKAKIRATLKGRVMPDAQREKLLGKRLGVKLSEEVRAKISASVKAAAARRKAQMVLPIDQAIVESSVEVPPVVMATIDPPVVDSAVYAH